ncbi:uncharacterized protein LOC106134854 [Amyelois transitella]|uniref:uncharacterized protein LOC106134854 n=1 Tax=Amyelois transitella TaxID=680683 RepID=UPI00067AD936|nr:uncharacterized protein LOC106134854 [Amyelois transitella]
MFKIPGWGDDVPNTNIQFGKTTKKKKKNGGVSETGAKHVSPQKTKRQMNDQTKPLISNGNSIRPNNKKKKRKAKPVVSTINSDIPTFKPGQFVLNPNKRKLENDFVSNVDDSLPKSSKKKKRKKSSNSTVNTNDTKVVESNKNVKTEGNKEIGIILNSKKEKIKKMLALSNRNPIDGSSNSNNLRQRMLEKLKAAQFRYLNEKLYTSSGAEAKQLFQNDPEAFQTYHQGYQQQLKKWPVNPLDLIVKRIMKMPKTHTIADLGCGEAALSKRVPHTVRSFDLVAAAPGVEVCDMAHTPLLSESMDVAVYCLALMGTDLAQYLVEANRILKAGGILLIAEVESRFDKVESFTDAVQRLGFKLKTLDNHQVFVFMEFAKVTHAPAKKSKLPDVTLKPCLYKRR